MRALPPFQQVTQLSALVKVPGIHEALVTQELLSVVGALAGTQRAASTNGTQLLLSPPHHVAWSLKSLNWHVDIPGTAAGPLPGVQMFALLADVEARGGATLAIAGSHRIRAQSPEGSALRDALRSSEDVEAGVRALGCQVVEMCGRAGDVFLMDTRVLHTPSINASKRIRMMATTRFHLSP